MLNLLQFLIKNGPCFYSKKCTHARNIYINAPTFIYLIAVCAFNRSARKVLKNVHFTTDTITPQFGSFVGMQVRLSDSHSIRRAVSNL